MSAFARGSTIRPETHSRRSHGTLCRGKASPLDRRPRVSSARKSRGREQRRESRRLEPQPGKACYTGPERSPRLGGFGMSDCAFPLPYPYYRQPEHAGDFIERALDITYPAFGERVAVQGVGRGPDAGCAATAGPPPWKRKSATTTLRRATAEIVAALPVLWARSTEEGDICCRCQAARWY